MDQSNTPQTQPEEVIAAETALATEATGDTTVVAADTQVPAAEVIGVDIGNAQDTTVLVADGTVIAEVPPVDQALSAAVGEPVTAAVVADAPVVVDAPVVAVVDAVVETAPVVTSDILDINSLPISVNSKIALQNVTDYLINMKPRKPVFPDEGARHQVGLFRAIMAIINGQEDDFQVAFNTLLKIIHDNRDGAFHETCVFRFFEHMALPENDRRAFQRLLNLVKLTADPKSRSLVMSQIDMASTLEHAVSDHGRNKVLAFFGL